MRKIARTIILMVVLLAVVFQSTIAVAFDDFYSESEIQFIDPNACDPTNTGEPQDNPSVTATGTGKWSLGPNANRAGAELTPLFSKFLDELAKYTSYEPIVTTGTNHSQFSSSGNVSDHWAGNGADFFHDANKFGTDNAQPGQDVPRGDEIAAAAFIAAGMDEATAKKRAKQGNDEKYNGSFNSGGVRLQVIWKSDVGGNHHDHVHVGIASLSRSALPGDALSKNKLASENQDTNIIDNIIKSAQPFSSASAVAPAGGEDIDETTGTPPGSIYIMGDSITSIAKNSYLKKFKDPWKPTVEGLVSRQIDSTPPSPSGIGQIAKDDVIVKNAKAIVIALGTNGTGNSEASIKADVKKAVGDIRDHNASAPLYWVNVVDTRSYENSQKTNRAIKEGLGSQGRVIDWYKEAKGDADNPGKANLASFEGGVHPTKQSDIDLLVDLVYKDVSANTGTASTEDKLTASSCCPAADSNQPAISGNPNDELVEGTSAAQQVFNYLKRKGATNAGAAGIVGNLMQESGGGTYNLNPKITNSSGHRGIAQWDSSVRWPKLVTYANSLPGSPSPDSIKAQRAYLWKEIEDDYASLLATVKTTSDVKKAATQFEADFERSGGDALSDRIKFAEKAFNDFSDESPASPEAASSVQVCVCPDPNASSEVSGANPTNLKAFIEKYADAALAAGKKEGVPYDAMLAQIAHESGIPLSELAARYNNFGGIKFTGTGESTPPMRTFEEGQGYIMARFRAFPTAEEGIQQQAKFFTENSRYKNALNYPRNPERFIQEVAKAGYATDSLYAQKVIVMLKNVQKILVELNKPLSKDVQPDNAPGGGDKSDEATTPSVLTCAGSAAAGQVIEGFAFPVGKLKQSEVGANNRLPCNTSPGCHHDGSAAFDLGKAGSNGILGSASKGLPVYAIEGGIISSYSSTYKGIATCPHYQLKGKSGWVYWYGHTQTRKLKEGTKVEAGEEIGVIGPSLCTGAGPTNPPHLHIDRGSPKGNNGGGISSRDSSINEVINKLWEALP